MARLPRFLRRDRFQFEHERYERCHDKLRGDGRTVFVDGFVRGQGRKLELVEPDTATWEEFWRALAAADTSAWTDGSPSAESWWQLSVRRAGVKAGFDGCGACPEELTRLLTTLVGHPLAAAREALLPEPAIEDGEEDGPDDGDVS